MKGQACFPSAERPGRRSDLPSFLFSGCRGASPRGPSSWVLRLTGHHPIASLRMSGASPVLRHMPFGTHRCNCSEVHFGDSIDGENTEIVCGMKWLNVWSTVMILTCKRAALSDLSDSLPCSEEALNPDVVSSGCHVGSSEERALFCRVHLPADRPNTPRCVAAAGWIGSY